ncbi:MAG: tetratricopeptide repeat protein [Myxococcales bacterium]|nr:tetratricopeptide repeat protein [Myxococcales bacterium]
MRFAACVALAATAAPVVAGCVSRAAGEQLIADGRARDQRLDALEQQLSTSNGQLAAQLAQLQKSLEHSTSVVTRNSADAGAEVQQLRQQLATMEGTIAELRQRLEQSTKAAQAEVDAAANKTSPGVIPTDPLVHFAAAKNAYERKDYDDARTLFEAYVRRYPRSDLADDARYWAGMTYLEQGKPSDALRAFRAVLAGYPDGDAVDDTLLAMSDAFYQLGACGDATTTLHTLLETQSGSPLVPDAKKKLRALQHPPKGACKTR